MARPKAGSNLSIAELESLIENRRTELAKLQKEHSKLQDQLSTVEKRISMLGGRADGRRPVMVSSGAGSRPRNAKSLVASLEQVLSGASEPMRVGDIVDSVLKTGYRTSSENFRGIVNQTLIKERKLFSSAGRGLYVMKGKRS